MPVLNLPSILKSSKFGGESNDCPCFYAISLDTDIPALIPVIQYKRFQSCSTLSFLN